MTMEPRGKKKITTNKSSFVFGITYFPLKEFLERKEMSFLFKEGPFVTQHIGSPV